MSGLNNPLNNPFKPNPTHISFFPLWIHNLFSIFLKILLSFQASLVDFYLFPIDLNICISVIHSFFIWGRIIFHFFLQFLSICFVLLYFFPFLSFLFSFYSVLFRLSLLLSFIPVFLSFNPISLLLFHPFFLSSLFPLPNALRNWLIQTQLTQIFLHTFFKYISFS